MGPRLSAITGPLQGSSFSLTDAEIFIGRDPSNTICVTDLLLSRQHSVIRKDEMRFTIADLDSLNGIFVNKKRVMKHVLQHGDQIQLGESLFVFLEENEKEAISQVNVDKSIFSAQSTVQLRIEDAVYLKQPLQGARLPTEKIAQDLSSLLKISDSLNSLQDVTVLQRKLLEMILEILPAERGAILLRSEESKEFCGSYALDTRSGATVPVNHSIAHQVFQERTAILCNGVTRGEPFSTAFAGSEIQSLLCVPLVAFEKRLGVLYLDTSEPNVSFNESHLQLLTGAAGIAAVALKNALHAENLKDENCRLKAETAYHMVGESSSYEEDQPGDCKNCTN